MAPTALSGSFLPFLREDFADGFLQAPVLAVVAVGAREFTQRGHGLKAIANDATLNLYTRIDLYLSKKVRWERRTLELFRDEPGLVGKRYEKRFACRAKMRDLLKSRKVLCRA